MKTQYDFEPNTGHTFPPSKDAMMTIIVEEALAEPRLHVALEGGPAELAGYKLEVVEGIKDHWVKESPRDKKWSYTYHGRIAAYGGKLNFALEDHFADLYVFDAPGPPAWVGLAYHWEDATNMQEPIQTCPPFDQIQYIVDTLAEAPFSRRAVASTAFPPADATCDDPPCLQKIWCRGYYADGCLKIDMHTNWRSNDAWGASLFNMFALTELQRNICERLEDKFDLLHSHDDLKGTAGCPVCGGVFRSDYATGSIPGVEGLASDLECEACGLHPYRARAGAYVHTADSYHIYGNDITRGFEEDGTPIPGDFVNKFLPSLELPESRRFWDLSTPAMQEIMAEGEEKERQLVLFKGSE